ncbi:DUF4124 domain-containing protein [Andreprevotia chitinilytica]|uniref:DUF4124 domain-containing protein n=1 Tax=Andreprevotia chitinilytica TaxID=396808 RepID=UPI00055855FB|nr:DUF4124 domain-containing protein [Andreprevotia chitinilytica]
MRLGVLTVVCLTLFAGPLEAKLYKWVDENGNVQFSDKPPVGNTKSGVTELDQRGMVRKVPEKKISEEEKARQQDEQEKQREQQRRDKALLQSFSKPEDIDLLRDRQIEAIQSGIQTNKLRRQSADGRLKRIQEQIARLQKAKRQLPADLDADRAVAQKEIDDIDADTQKKLAEIEDVKKHAAADKQRFVELQQGTKPTPH